MLTQKNSLNRNKPTAAITFLLILMLATSAILATALTVNAQTRVEETWAFISVAPNPIGLGQSIHIRLFLVPFPPTANDFFHGFRYTITKPDGTIKSGGPFVSDPNAAYDFAFTPTAIGTYNVTFNYPGETFNNGTITKLPSQTQTTFTVQQDQVPTWPDTPLPTGYWTRPISAEFRTWNSISGNWLQGAYDAAGRCYADNAAFNPYTQAPRASHIVWSKDAALGGLVGGEFGSENFYPGIQYDGKVTPPLVIDGRLYYRLFQSSSGAAGSYKGFVCVDLRSGQEYWRNTTGNIDIGQTYVSLGYNGQGARAFLWDYSSTTWTVYDAWSGQLFWTLTGALASPSKIFYGDNGDIYAYFATGTDANRRLIMWNSTRAWEKYGWFSGNTLRSDRPGAYNWSQGIQYNVTVQSVASLGFGALSISVADPLTKMLILSATPPEETNGGKQIMLGYDGMTGAKLWTLNKEWSMLNSRIAAGQGMLVQMDMGQQRRSGIDFKTGVEKWQSDPTLAPWGIYSGYGINAYDKSFSGAYDGYLRAVDLNTGKQVWQYYIGDSGLETPYGTWPVFNGPMVGGYVVFGGYSEHTPSTPLFRGGRTFALDATTGRELWTINGWFSVKALADGYLVTMNAYDNQIYVFGKGPSKTTVTAPQVVVSKGTGVMITGTVTDQSPGKPDTPAISDASMSAWMEYLYLQKPIPGNATGVPVQLSATGPNGEAINIGTVTSDIGGTYGIMWTPPTEGQYTIMATFPGSDSYGSSFATTRLGVGPAATAAPTVTSTPTVTQTPTVTTAPPVTTPSPAINPNAGINTAMYVAIAAVVIIIVIAVVAVVLRRRK